MRPAGLALLLAAAACLEAPDYTGRVCDALNPCPGGYQCASDGRCAIEGADGGVLPGDASPLDAGERTDTGSLDAAGLDAAPSDGEHPDADPVDAGLWPDAEDPIEARCRDVVRHPASGWEARHFRLDGNGELGVCAGVEDLAGDGISRDYMSGGPLPGLTERFGSRYTATRTFQEGVHTLTLDHDDGLRVFIDGALVYERWQDGVQLGVTVRTPHLAAGPHQIAIEHYELQGFARIGFDYQRGCGALEAIQNGWTVGWFRLAQDGSLDRAACFGVETVQGGPLSLSYAGGAPALVAAQGVSDGFGFVARGRRSFTGATRFTFSHDDGLRVSVAGTAVYDGWTNGPQSNRQVEIYTVGTRDVELEGSELTGDAAWSVAWSSVCAIQTAPSPTAWRARYFPAVMNANGFALDRSTCLGAETITGAQLAAQWMGGAAGPPSGLGITEMWGAEYTGPRSFGANTTINLHHDDGLRVYSGAVLLYESWTAPQVITTSMVITAGDHDLRLEYFEWQGGAGIGFTW